MPTVNLCVQRPSYHDTPAMAATLGLRHSHMTTPARSSKKVTSHYSPFQVSCAAATDDPPTYHTASRQRACTSPQHINGRPLRLPGYSCTVATQGKFQLRIETYNPLDGIAVDAPWREVYLILQGTVLSIHKVANNGPGKLLRAYTLQHAETGLALDCDYTVLIPQSRWARLIPAPARHKAWQKDPQLFSEQRQHALRLRAELHQMVLAHESEETIHKLLHALSAAIDISLSLDERSMPKQRTVPRRRQRHHRTQQTLNIDDPAVIAEQERLLRDAYPAFAEGQTTASNTAETPSEERGPISGQDDERETPDELEPLQTVPTEDDELDLAMMREGLAPSSNSSSLSPARGSRPANLRRATTTTIHSMVSMADSAVTCSSADFDGDGKWRPPCARTPEQIDRYMRRCLPLLPADAPRASDIVMCFGERYKINWHLMILESWELKPPSYKSHAFPDTRTAQRSESPSESRSASQNSPHDSAVNVSVSSDSGVDTDDLITSADTALAGLELSKCVSSPAADSIKHSQTVALKSSGRTTTSPVNDIQGMIFSF